MIGVLARGPRVANGNVPVIAKTSCPKRTLVVTRTPPPRARRDMAFVATPLDLIKILEQEREGVDAVVLTGTFASMRELTMFLVDAYPSLRILSGHAGEEPDTYLPQYS